MRSRRKKSDPLFEEIRMFAGFSSKVQRYIRISLLIAQDADQDLVTLCSRTVQETEEIRERQRVYMNIDNLSECFKEKMGRENFAYFVGYIIPLASYDLSHGIIWNFTQFMFLYERIFGAKIRMYLPMIYSAAAASPFIRGEIRDDLFDNIHISEASAPPGFWSTREPSFFPGWVDKVEEFTK
jgi:hypothetical protein